QGAPVYLRDAFDIERGYESPPRYLNKYTWRTKATGGGEGAWSRTRAVTLAVYMRSGMQIGAFGKAIDAALAETKQLLPEDLIIALAVVVVHPAVAGDGIMRDLAPAAPPIVAAWLGPTRLARAILFATITSVVAYLPLLTLPGGVGRCIGSLPIVLTCAVVAS